MADERRDGEQLEFDVAERVLGEPEPADAQRPSGHSILRRAGRTAATALPLLLIAGLGALNVSLVLERGDEGSRAEPRKASTLPERESLAVAPGPDALGLRQRYVRHDRSRSDNRAKNSLRGDRIKRGGLTLTGAKLSGNSILSSVAASPSSAAAGSSTKSGVTKKKAKPSPEPIPEPSAILYRMWNSQTNDHYFTINEEEKDRLINEGYSNYATEGIIFPTQERGTYPIHTDDGIVGYAFGKQHENTVPLYFLRGPNGEGDLFTTSQDTKERWQLQKGWDYHGIVGYIGKWGPP